MKNKNVTVYICGVDWLYELGETTHAVYSTVKSLKKDNPCWKGCGIVKLNVTLDSWVYKQNFKEMRKTAIPAKDMDKYQKAEVKKQIKGLEKLLKKLEKPKRR